ncbi:peroxisome assembly protein (Peroxin-2) [Homalodisca vitripennis]|nr:peroxisome assembly protein (Peroxin-2) [Homalodisca vitripennis]
MGSPASNNYVHEKPAARVTVLDAADFDSEIQRILKEQLLKIVSTLYPSLVKCEPELDALLSAVIWKLSMSHCQATFGQQLLSLKYGRDITPVRAAAWATLNIGCRYLSYRSTELTSLLVPSQHKNQVSRLLGWLELCVQVASLLNYLLFLRQGVFPNLTDRLVNIKPVSATSMSRAVGYSYMTRELLWHGFIELLVFVFPLVNYKYLQRYVRKCVGYTRAKDGRQESLVYTVATRCAVCLEPPVLPHHMGCAHSFCYYCVQSNRMADSKFECPSCGHSDENPSAVQPVTARFSGNS